MLIERKFRHPLHMVNHYRAIVKQALRDYVPRHQVQQQPPQLDNSLDYYFIFETAPKAEINELVYGLTCFDSDGVVLFDVKGSFPVSLWRWRRQGLARCATMTEGIIKTIFKRKLVPLQSDEPFRAFADGLYLCNISWSMYQSYLK